MTSPVDPSTSKSTHAELSSALLIEANEIENRLRQHVLTLVEPCLKKQKAFDIRFKEMKSSVDKHGSMVEKLSKMLEDEGTMRQMVEAFRAEMANWDMQRHDHERALSGRISQQETDLDALRQSLQHKATEIASNGRVLKSLTESIAKAHDQMVELRQYCSERVDTNRDKIFKLRDEVETKHLSLECTQHKLQDSLSSTETIICLVRTQLERVTHDVVSMSEEIKDLKLTKASINCMEVQQHEFEEFTQQLNVDVESLRQQIGGLMRDVKAHFQSAVQVVGTSTGKQMDTMRVRYETDAEKLTTALAKMNKFVESHRSAEQALRDNLAEVRNNSAKQLQDLRELVEAQTQMRNSECGSASVEVMQLRKRVIELEACKQRGDSESDMRNDVLSMMVESELLGATLELQDDQDRKSVGLFGFKGTEGKHPPYSYQRDDGARGWSLPELDGSTSGQRASALARPSAATDVTRTPRRRAAAAAPAVDSPVMTIDNRCLSCSGSAATVLAGFKMACLQYAPSPVMYRDVPHSRSELIKLRLDLLSQAKERLQVID